MSNYSFTGHNMRQNCPKFTSFHIKFPWKTEDSNILQDLLKLYRLLKYKKWSIVNFILYLLRDKMLGKFHFKVILSLKKQTNSFCTQNVQCRNWNINLKHKIAKVKHVPDVLRAHVKNVRKQLLSAPKGSVHEKYQTYLHFSWWNAKV